MNTVSPDAATNKSDTVYPAISGKGVSMLKEIFVVPEFAVKDIEHVWGDKLRSDEMETALDLYNLAKEMGLVQLEVRTNRKMVGGVEVSA